MIPVITRPCMGGFCDCREKCADYHLATEADPIERKCPIDEEKPEWVWDTPAIISL